MGHDHPVEPTRFLVLRDGRVYFQGSEQQLTHSPDPYLRKFLA
jgi:ABC-type transporter Mla maintaining outer membrane lipid asymmetry ATPase subunit MlaF